MLHQITSYFFPILAIIIKPTLSISSTTALSQYSQPSSITKDESTSLPKSPTNLIWSSIISNYARKVVYSPSLQISPVISNYASKVVHSSSLQISPIISNYATKVVHSSSLQISPVISNYASKVVHSSSLQISPAISNYATKVVHSSSLQISPVISNYASKVVHSSSLQISPIISNYATKVVHSSSLQISPVISNYASKVVHSSSLQISPVISNYASKVVHSSSLQISPVISNYASKVVHSPSLQISPIISNYATKAVHSSSLQVLTVSTVSCILVTENLHKSTDSSESTIFATPSIHSSQGVAPTITTVARNNSAKIHQSSPLSEHQVSQSLDEARITDSATVKKAAKVNCTIRENSTKETAVEAQKTTSKADDDVARSTHVFSTQSYMRESEISLVKSPAVTTISSGVPSSIRQCSFHKGVPASSISNAKPTKDVTPKAVNPTTKTTEPTRVDFSKFMAVGFSTLVIVALLVTAIALAIRKNRFVGLNFN